MTFLFLFFPDKDIKGAWDYKMRNVRKKLPQLLIAVMLVILAIIWIIHSDFLAPVDRLPDNHGLEARILSLERTRVPSKEPHSKPRNLSERKQYKPSFAGKIPSVASKRAHARKKHVLIGCKSDMFWRQTIEVWSSRLLST